MAKRLKHSRWRRLPGAFRVAERKFPDEGDDLQRLSLYIPGRLLDQAEALAIRAGASSVQAYCETLLGGAIESEHTREQLAEVESRRKAMEGWDAIANDADYLAEWSRSAERERDRPTPEADASVDGPSPTADEEPTMGEAEETILRHAGMGFDDPSGLLPTLRRGEGIGPEPARELLRALVRLEAKYRDAPRLDRRLAYALHRLAFEGQVLLTDAWPHATADQATVDVLRLVQEAVDRVLSGEDIRYYPEQPPPEEAP